MKPQADLVSRIYYNSPKSIGTIMLLQTVLTQIRRNRVYTVCHTYSNIIDTSRAGLSGSVAQLAARLTGDQEVAVLSRTSRRNRMDLIKFKDKYGK